MDYTKEYIAGWLDDYFEGVNRNQGTMEEVSKSRRYFSDDLEFLMYTSVRLPPGVALTKEELLILFVHPGLHEKLTPNYYVIDAESMRAMVQFELWFRDVESGVEWPRLQASACYEFTPNGAGGMHIRRIQYWTQRFTDEFDSLFRLWNQKKDAALNELGREFFRTGAVV